MKSSRRRLGRHAGEEAHGEVERAPPRVDRRRAAAVRARGARRARARPASPRRSTSRPGRGRSVACSSSSSSGVVHGVSCGVGSISTGPPSVADRRQHLARDVADRPVGRERDALRRDRRCARRPLRGCAGRARRRARPSRRAPAAAASPSRARSGAAPRAGAAARAARAPPPACRAPACARAACRTSRATPRREAPASRVGHGRHATGRSLPCARACQWLDGYGSATASGLLPCREEAAAEHEHEADHHAGREPLAEQRDAEHRRDRGVDVRDHRCASRAYLRNQREEEEERERRTDRGEPYDRLDDMSRRTLRRPARGGERRVERALSGRAIRRRRRAPRGRRASGRG